MEVKNAVGIYLIVAAEQQGKKSRLHNKGQSNCSHTSVRLDGITVLMEQQVLFSKDLDFLCLPALGCFRLLPTFKTVLTTVILNVKI